MSRRPPQRPAASRRAEPAFPPIRAIGRPWEPQKDIYHFLLRRSWSGFFLVVTVGFLLANAFFATLYVLQPGGIQNARPGSFEDAFFFSVQTIATIGYGGMAPGTLYTHVVVTIEALVGIISVALVTGITFTKFSRPTARVVFSERMVVAKRDGVPHLMFRLANWRHNQVLEAQLRLVLLLTEVTAEGDSLRRPQELTLVRDRNPLFSLTWVAMHKIDESSPFFGPNALETLRAQRAQLFVTLYGVDETVGQNIHARHRYGLDDIVWGGRFRDLLIDLDDGSRQLDYRVFHEIDLDARRGDLPDDPTA
ncbi:MAG TPA: ion channel [Polyangia bacterium]|jgi:inward rectifier potassium channel|nr:ion channel [Polyangia bacterium]